MNDMLIGILGHDLRSPLNAVALGATYLARKHKGDRESVDALDGIARASSG